MGILFLSVAKIAGIIKVIYVKKSGSIAPGVRNGININLIRSLICFAVSLVVFSFSIGKVGSVGLWVSLCSGISNALFILAWILSTEKTSLCMVEIMSTIGSVVIPLLLTPIIYPSETITIEQWIGTTLLIVAVVLFSGKTDKKNSRVTPILLILCALSGAGVALTQKLFTTYEQGSVACFQLITFAVSLVVFLILHFLLKKRTDAKVCSNINHKVWIFILISSIMLYTNQYFQTEAAKYFSSAIFYPLTYAVGLPLTFFADLFVFGESLKLKRILGLLVTIVAIILVV